MNHPDMYDRIELYMLGKLSDSEKAQFEAELSTNKELSEAFAQQEFEHKIMEVLVEDDLRRDLSDWQNINENKENLPTKASKQISWLKLVAIALVFLLLILFLMQSKEDDVPKETLPEIEQVAIDVGPVRKDIPSPPAIDTDTSLVKEKVINPEDANKPPPPRERPQATESPQSTYASIADTYSEVIDFDNTTRDGQSALDSALVDLTKGAYNNGTERLTKLLLHDSTNLNIIYYLGLAHYAQRQFTIAIPFLRTISEKIYLHNERAQWLLILAYLQNNNKTLAEQSIKEILDDPGHPYFDRVNSLRSDLEGLYEK